MLPGSKSTISLLLLLLVLAAAFLFFVPVKNGKPLLSLDRLPLQKLSDIKLPPINLSNPSENAASGPVTVYKWQDASGNWHFSNEPPSGNTRYQTTEVDPNANLIQGGVSSPAKDKSSGKQSTANNRSGETDAGLEKLSDMIEPARKAKNALRAHEQEELKKTE